MPKTDNSYLKSPIVTFFYAIRPYRWRFGVMLALIIIGNAFSYTVPYFMKLIADKVVGATTLLTFHDFLPILLIILGLLIGQEFGFRVAHFLETTFVVKAYDWITSKLFGFLLNRPTAYFEEKFSGELTRRVEQVGSAIKFFVADFVWEMAWPILAVIMSLFLLFNAQFWLGIVFSVWFVIFFIISFFLLRLKYLQSQNLAEKQADLTGTLVDALSNVSLVHTFAAHEYEYTHYRKGF